MSAAQATNRRRAGVASRGGIVIAGACRCGCGVGRGRWTAGSNARRGSDGMSVASVQG
ncbi:MAG: hypothetical protein ACXVUL_03940 [Solirubrobacteraceae bacterium]